MDNCQKWLKIRDIAWSSRTCSSCSHRNCTRVHRALRDRPLGRKPRADGFWANGSSPPRRALEQVSALESGAHHAMQVLGHAVRLCESIRGQIVMHHHAEDHITEEPWSQ